MPPTKPVWWDNQHRGAPKPLSMAIAAHAEALQEADELERDRLYRTNLLTINQMAGKNGHLLKDLWLDRRSDVDMDERHILVCTHPRCHAYAIFHNGVIAEFRYLQRDCSSKRDLEDQMRPPYQEKEETLPCTPPQT